MGFSRPALAAEMVNYARLNFTEVVDRPFAAHDVEHAMVLLRVLTGGGETGLAVAAGPVELWVDGRDMAAAEGMLGEMGVDAGRPVVAVCPGASGRNREVPVYKLRSMLQRVKALVPGVQFVFLGRATARTLCGELRMGREMCGGRRCGRWWRCCRG